LVDKSVVRRSFKWRVLPNYKQLWYFLTISKISVFSLVDKMAAAIYLGTTIAVQNGFQSAANHSMPAGWAACPRQTAHGGRCQHARQRPAICARGARAHKIVEPAQSTRFGS
jgi:hypothetical protein